MRLICAPTLPESDRLPDLRCVGGLQTLIQSGETGLFFDPDAPDAATQLATQFTALHRNPGLRQALGEAGRSEALASYDWSRITARLESIYQQAEANAAQRWSRRP